MEAERHLQTAADRLRKREYAASRAAASQAMQSDPRIPGAELIIAVCDVFLAVATRPSPNWYSILKLETFTQDTELIADQHGSVISLLSPGKNPFSYAYEAFKMVREAFRVLSVPESKEKYDEELREKMAKIGQGFVEEEVEVVEEEVVMERVERKVKKRVEKKVEREKFEVFWTICPYCYCVFEYEKRYVGLCLRCQICRRGFHGVEIQWPPPGGIEEDQRNYFVGFMPFGIQQFEQDGKEKERGFEKESGASVIDISDDDDCQDPKAEMENEIGAAVSNDEAKVADGAQVVRSGGVGSVRGRGGRKKTMARKKTRPRFKAIWGSKDSEEDESSEDSSNGDGGGGSSARNAATGVNFVETSDDLMVCLEDL